MSPLRPRIQQKLDGMVARVNELLAQSADPKLVERPDRLAALQRELGQMTPIVKRYETFTQLLQQSEEQVGIVDHRVAPAAGLFARVAERLLRFDSQSLRSDHQNLSFLRIGTI